MQKTISIISLSAIEHNARVIKDRLGKRKFYAVVKADAYGHGAETVAQTIQSIADGFCVAIVEEGVALRLCGITKPIIVLCPPLDLCDVHRCEFYNLTPTVNGVDTARLIGALHCHVKINTGMNRYGVNLSDLENVLNLLDSEQVEGVYTHLYQPNDSSIVAEQISLFNKAEEIVKARGDGAIAHVVASAGLTLKNEYLKDGARVGLALYGYSPENFKITGLVPALKVYARRVQTTKRVGRGAGYNLLEEGVENLATYRLGYADGFLRSSNLGIGNLCMDAFVGDDKGETALVLDDAFELAKRNSTITYETLCLATMRSEKIYER